MMWFKSLLVGNQEKYTNIHNIVNPPNERVDEGNQILNLELNGTIFLKPRVNCSLPIDGRWIHGVKEYNWHYKILRIPWSRGGATELRTSVYIKTLPIDRYLGVHWCVDSDESRINIDVKGKPATRRDILSMTSSVPGIPTASPVFSSSDVASRDTTGNKELSTLKTSCYNPLKYCSSHVQLQIDLTVISDSDQSTLNCIAGYIIKAPKKESQSITI
ncbi:unnamed protein product [Mytilus coruscus]|uniref:Uncharacterized protein n=1 Tax=Mytilus coruscus TaxID=42192 RepID=A0A6J8AI65_MYTCO|nr:unnamed protein product [Mytilus coruscus]